MPLATRAQQCVARRIRWVWQTQQVDTLVVGARRAQDIWKIEQQPGQNPFPHHPACWICWVGQKE
eukprot:1406748-Lingulodinium_polyedra.AAC.1